MHKLAADTKQSPANNTANTATLPEFGIKPNTQAAYTNFLTQGIGASPYHKAAKNPATEHTAPTASPAVAKAHPGKINGVPTAQWRQDNGLDTQQQGIWGDPPAARQPAQQTAAASTAKGSGATAWNPENLLATHDTNARYMVNNVVDRNGLPISSITAVINPGASGDDYKTALQKELSGFTPDLILDTRAILRKLIYRGRIQPDKHGTRPLHNCTTW